LRPAGRGRDEGSDAGVRKASREETAGEYGYTPYLRRKKRATRQYARIIHRWVERAGRDGSAYGRIRCGTKAAQIYRKMGNLRSVQLLRGQTKLESTVRYLGIEVDDALTISEQVEL
jgi:hypothetical protein